MSAPSCVLRMLIGGDAWVGSPQGSPEGSCRARAMLFEVGGRAGMLGRGPPATLSGAAHLCRAVGWCDGSIVVQWLIISISIHRSWVPPFCAGVSVIWVWIVHFWPPADAVVCGACPACPAGAEACFRRACARGLPAVCSPAIVRAGLLPRGLDSLPEIAFGCFCIP